MMKKAYDTAVTKDLEDDIRIHIYNMMALK